MLLSIPPKISVSGFMGFLKGKSSLMIYQKWGSMKFKYRNRQFWCRGYYVDTVGKNAKAIKEYIENQLKKDKGSEQLSIFDPRDNRTAKGIICLPRGSRRGGGDECVQAATETAPCQTQARIGKFFRGRTTERAIYTFNYNRPWLMPRAVASCW